MRRDDFIPPPPADEADFFQRATIVLDTNVLLALYKLSAAAREDALRAIESSEERLWLPHQVGVEFYRNHASNRDLRSGAYDAATKQTDQIVELVAKHLGKGKTHADLRKNVAKVVRDAVSEMKAQIEQLRIKDAAITTPDSDNILQRLEAAFDGRAATAPDPEIIRGRTQEFMDWRVPSQIPPGFKDWKQKSGLSQSAGDFLIWAEILKHAATNNLDILFVTEDGKDDWWEVIDDERRPHRALTLEFQRATGPGRGYHQVSMETFVRLATDAAGSAADQSTLNEIVAVNKEAQEMASQVEKDVIFWLKDMTWRELGAHPKWTHLPDRNVAIHMPFLNAEHLQSLDPETRRLLDDLKQQIDGEEDQGNAVDESGDDDSPNGSN